MLRRWTVSNFKSIYGRTSLELAPLTVLAGANSSGKSALIQSILVVAQTINHRIKERPVILNGHMVRLGTFDDVFSIGAEGKSISFGFEYLAGEGEHERTYEPGAPFWFGGHMLSACECEFTFSAGDRRIPNDPLQLQPRLEHCKVTATEKRRSVSHTIEVRRREASLDQKLASFNISKDDLNTADENILLYDVIAPATYERSSIHRRSPFPPDSKIAGVHLAHFLPDGLGIVYDRKDLHARYIVGQLTATDPFRPDQKSLDVTAPPLLSERVLGIITEYLATTPVDKLGFSPATLFQEVSQSPTIKNLQSLNRRLRSKMLETVYREHFEELVALARESGPPEMQLGLDEPNVDTYSLLAPFFLERLRYLGPLRDEPKVVYPVEGAVDPTNVGLRGEHTAAVLDINRNTFVDYLPPPAAERTSDQPPPAQSATLLSAVVEWLSYLGVVEGVETEDKGVYGHELRVRPDKGGRSTTCCTLVSV